VHVGKAGDVGLPGAVDVGAAEFGDHGVVHQLDEAHQTVDQGEVAAGGTTGCVEGGADHVGGGFGVDFAGAHDETGSLGPMVEEFVDEIGERLEDGGLAGAEAAGTVVAEEGFGAFFDDGAWEEEGVAVEEDFHAGGGGIGDLAANGGFAIGGFDDVGPGGGLRGQVHVGGGDGGESVGDDDGFVAVLLEQLGIAEARSERRLAVIVMDHVDEHGIVVRGSWFVVRGS